MMRLEYTVCEGGIWHELFTEDSKESIVKNLKKMWHPPFGSHSYIGKIKVHSVKFPKYDSPSHSTFDPEEKIVPHIWDSYFGGWRPMNV